MDSKHNPLSQADTAESESFLIQQQFFECKKCEEAFENSEMLWQHVRNHHKHLQNNKYICKLCGNQFGGHAQLSAHQRLHKERQFKCDKCQKAYPRQADLDIHMRSHTGELPYGCNVCNKRFAIKVRLTYHLQKHDGVKHSCSYCSAVYDNRSKLKTHLFKHTGMPYICEICPHLAFDRRIRFANHMHRVHQRNLTDDELSEIFAKNTGKTIRFKPTKNDNNIEK